MLGIELAEPTWATFRSSLWTAYGEFVRGPNGFPQIVVGLGADGKFGGGDDVFVEGTTPLHRVNPPARVGAFRTGHAFLGDIAHAAKP